MAAAVPLLLPPLARIDNLSKRRLCEVVLCTSAVVLPMAGCAKRPPVPLPVAPVSGADAARAADEADGLLAGRSVQTTIVAGQAPPPAPPQSVQIAPRSGDVSLNFPNADVRVVAKAVLGDLLHTPYTIDPAATAAVTLVTAQPVARAALLDLFERALRAANLGLVPQGGGYQITSTATAGATAPIAPAAIGYGTETIKLKFVSADEMHKLLDSVVPGTVTSTDPTQNTLVITGTTGQRAAVRDILQQFDVNWLRNMSFALYVPERTDSRLIAPELDKLINDPSAPTRGLVRLISMEKLNGILAISAQPQYLDDVRRWVEILDREGESSERKLFVYRVQNGRARDLARTLNTAFGNGGTGGSDENPDPLADRNVEPHSPPPPNSAFPPAPPPAANASGGAAQSPGAAGAAGAATLQATISADETNNAIIVYGTPRDYAVVEDALRKLDILPYQVLIEAAITEVTLTDSLRFGVQWNFDSGKSSFALGEGATDTPVRTFPGFSYFFAGNSISATLNALEQRTNIKVISAPKLLVLNNQTAALQVGDEVPITTQSATAVASGSVPAVVNSVEYRDTGVILKVTPRVNSSGLVLLDIAQEVSDVAANSSSGIDSPIISTRRISTSIAVQDGQVIALGGLFKNSRSYGKNGLPILSRIPIIGESLFGNRQDQQNRTELLVILKAHVLRTIDDGRAVTEELRAKIRTLEPFRTRGTIP